MQQFQYHVNGMSSIRNLIISSTSLSFTWSLCNGCKNSETTSVQSEACPFKGNTNPITNETGIEETECLPVVCLYSFIEKMVWPFTDSKKWRLSIDLLHESLFSLYLTPTKPPPPTLPIPLQRNFSGVTIAVNNNSIQWSKA